MFLLISTLSIVVVVIVSHVLLGYVIRDNETILMSEKAEMLLKLEKMNVAISGVLDATHAVAELQNTLDDKMDAFATLVDQHSTNVSLQQEHFEDLAKADVLVARREELHRTKELKVALERLMGVALTSRQPPAPNDVIALENLTKRIAELESILESGDI